MNWANRLRWRVVVPVAALAAMAAAALPAAAQAAGPPAPSAGSKVPVFKGIHLRTAGSAAAIPLPAAQAGATPAISATGSTTFPVAFAYTGSDNRVYSVPLGSPANALSLGGALTGGPGQAFVPGPIGPGFLIFAQGTDNALWLATGGTPAWVSFGGKLTSRPSVAAGALSVPGGEAVDVVVRGPDGAVYDREFTSTTTRPWLRLGGLTMAGSGPAAVNVGGTLYVLALGTTGTVFVNHSKDGAHWSGWSSLGGSASADVGAASPKPGVAVVFVRGPGNVAFYREFAGTTPGVTAGWHSLGGSLTSGVGAASASNGTTWTLVLGPDGNIYGRGGIWPNLRGWTRLL